MEVLLTSVLQTFPSFFLFRLLNPVKLVEEIYGNTCREHSSRNNYCHCCDFWVFQSTNKISAYQRPTRSIISISIGRIDMTKSMRCEGKTILLPSWRINPRPDFHDSRIQISDQINAI